MAECEKRDILSYTLFESRVDPTFFYKLTELKLDVDKLDEKPHAVWGVYECLSTHLNVDCSSFNSEFPGSEFSLAAYGVVFNKNTIEGFEKTDKMQLLQEQGAEMLKDIDSGRALSNPALLSKFVVLSFSDLKKYLFRYWFAFPTFSGNSFTSLARPVQMLKDIFSREQMNQLWRLFRRLNGQVQRTAFLLIISGEEVDYLPLDSITEAFPKWKDSLDGSYLVIVDPSPSSCGIAYTARNILLMLAIRFPELTGCSLRLICLRAEGHIFHMVGVNNSLLLEVVLDPAYRDRSALKWTGWEWNSVGKLIPKRMKLTGFMDPKRLAETSVDMNLKLMKWRLVPDLDLEVVKKTKCLLLGAGTLGCSVARVLLAWGVRSITLVDSGMVALSNPVRQSLYEHEDTLNNRKQKATTAAECLRRIFPGVDAAGVKMCIPMPGHGWHDAELNTKLLEALVETHDVSFLLTDSRESRWLPTLLGVAKRKLTICAALGFDTFLVMRHGVPTEDNQPSELGCYYCSDVVAPGNSQTDRTLDQQCTVTRPGLSAIAAGIAVELLMSILQHPLQAQAPAVTLDFPGEESLLGCVPHSVRGQLSQFHLITPTTPRFNNCIACSPKIVEEYEKDGLDFILKVLDSPDYLKKVSGLSQLCAETENIEVIALSDSDSEDLQ